MESALGITEAAYVGAFVGVALGLIEIVKRLIPSKNGFGAGDREILHKMRDWHGITDEDGIPLGYLPRRWGRTQEQILERLGVMAATQERTLTVLDALEQRLSSFQCPAGEKIRKLLEDKGV